METINKISNEEIEIVKVEEVTTKQKISKQMLLDEKAQLDSRLADVNRYLKEFD